MVHAAQRLDSQQVSGNRSALALISALLQMPDGCMLFVLTFLLKLNSSLRNWGSYLLSHGAIVLNELCLKSPVPCLVQNKVVVMEVSCFLQGFLPGKAKL